MTTQVSATLSDYEWAGWDAKLHATILFVVRDGQVLLIRKKRGIGAGKINGPGGKIDAGETPVQAAVREVEEELLITPIHVRAMGEIRFQFTDGLTIWGYVFRADGCIGEPTETDEAIPLLFPVDALPFAEMWPDDEVWLPWLLEGRRFEGRVLVGEDDALLDHDLHVVKDDHRWRWE